MKRIVILLMLTSFSLNLYAQMQKKRFSLGYSGGGTTITENATLGIDYRYNLTNTVRISPSVTKMLRYYGYTGWMFDANVHYVISFNDVFSIYPLAGFSALTLRNKVKNETEKAPRDTYFGANVGVGGEFYFVDEIIIGLDVKYNIQKKHDQMMAAIRIAYMFQSP